MKSRIPTFLAGMFAMLLLGALTLSALAVSGNVSFNLSAIKFDGRIISEAGDDYTLDSGACVPASITYTDENGGGTTYLPVRRIGELAGVTIDWDGAVVVKSKEFVEQEKREAERAAALDYSNWSAEEEAAYQEFKAMWILEEARPAQPIEEYPDAMFYSFVCSEKITEAQLIEIRDSNEKYLKRMLLEYAKDTNATHIMSGFSVESVGAFSFTVFQ